MKLDYDCMRDVLLELEDVLQVKPERSPLTNLYPDTKFDTPICFSIISIDSLAKTEKLRNHPKEVVFYALHNLNQAGYIIADINIDTRILSKCDVWDITLSGHMFLKSIHDDTIWSKVKARISSVGTVSLSMLTDIAAQIILKQIGL